MAKHIQIIILALAIELAGRRLEAQTTDAGVTILSPPTDGIRIGPGLEIILPPLRQPPPPVVVAPPPRPTVVPVALRPPPRPQPVAVSPPLPPPTVATPPPPPPTAQPLPVPPPNPAELQVASAGTAFVEEFDVDGTWSGQVLVNGVTVLRRTVPIRGTERPRIRVDPAPASMVGGLPGQIRVQVVCQTTGHPPRWAPVRWIWPNTRYRITPSYCDGW